MNTEKLISHFFSSSIQTCKEIFLKIGRLELGMCFILEQNGTIMQLPLPLTSNISKNIMASLIREITASVNPLALVFISEAWVATCDISDANDFLDGKKSVSEQPDKTECIMIIQETSKKTEAIMIPIIRGDKGVYFGEPMVTPNVQGRFANLL